MEAAPHLAFWPGLSLALTITVYSLWRDNQDENRATIRMRIDVATRPRVT